MFFLTGCDLSNKDLSYFPLSSGYKWRYDVSLITRDGLERQQYILNNVGKSKIENVTVFLKQTLDGTTLYYTQDDEAVKFLGMKTMAIPGGVFQPEKQIVMPKTVKVDAAWETMSTTKLLKKTGPPQKTEFKIIAKVPMEVSIESLSEKISVPAGLFENCMKITMTGSMMKDAGNYVGLTLIDVKETSWYAPNVGLIKLERIETTQSEALDRGSLLIELADFKRG